MPGRENIEKMRISLLIPIKTVIKLDRMVAESRFLTSRNEVANMLLDRATSDVVLTDDDLATIHERIRRNRDARN